MLANKIVFGEGKMKDKCKTCRYWERVERSLLKLGISDSKDHTIGECRRHPPTVYPLDKDRKHIDRLNRFPTVEEDCWCGEFELKDWQKK